MVVAPFLFYSGFGIMKSIQIKGDSYVKQIMKKRFPQVLFDFMRAVILFLILNLVLGKTYFLKQILLSFIGWESIGNSNWYILGILLLYIATFVSFTLVRACKGIKKDVLGCILLSLLISGIVCLLKISGKPSYYYNTLILYALGGWYVIFQEKIESCIMKNEFVYIFVVMIISCLYCLGYFQRWNYGILSYTAYAVMFIILLILIIQEQMVNIRNL